jgi:hypothetical protein
MVDRNNDGLTNLTMVDKYNDGLTNITTEVESYHGFTCKFEVIR